MSRYFFALNDELPSEQDGEAHESDKAALKSAEAIAEEIGRNDAKLPRIAVYKRIA